MDKKKIIKDFMSTFSLETTPGTAKKISNYRDFVPENTLMYITFLPSTDFKETIAVAKRLKNEGIIPIPHFAARSIKNKQVLENNIRACVEEAGVEQVLVIAGAVDNPIGDFSSSIQLLETGLFDKYCIKKIGLAAHPEGSPDISQEKISKAIILKNKFQAETNASLYLVTQFCFEAKPIIKWDKSLTEAGNNLPVHIGIPGLASLKSLISHSRACGVGASIQILTKQARNISKLLLINTPDELITDLAEYKATNIDCGISNVHMYPLGGLKKTSDWSYALQRGDFIINSKQNGFKVV